MLRESIENIVREAIEDIYFDDANLEEDGKKQKSNASKTKEKKQKKDAKHARSKSKLRSIIKWLKSDEVNQAAIMRKLWHPRTKKQENALRSEFSKKVNGQDSTGKRYSFDADDQNHLYSIKTSSAV